MKWKILSTVFMIDFLSKFGFVHKKGTDSDLLDTSRTGKTIGETGYRGMPQDQKKKKRGSHHFLRRQLRRHLKMSIEERAA